MNKEERQLLIAKFWCDVYLNSNLESHVLKSKQADDALADFSKRFPEEDKHYCAYHRTWGDHDTNKCPMLMQKPTTAAPGVLGGIV